MGTKKLNDLEEVVIVGGGVAGLATAVALMRVGIDVLVLERSDALRITTGTALTLAPNAWIALHALGVAHKLLPLYQPFSKDDSGLPRTVHRSALLNALAEELPPDTIRFSSNLVSIQTQSYNNTSSSITILHMDDGITIHAKVLIGCDGVNSEVARWLGLSEPIHSGRSAVRGLSFFPENHGLNHGPQQFIDGANRAGFIPLNNNTIYWFFVCKSTLHVKDMNNPKNIQREVVENLGKNLPPIYKEIVHHSNLPTLSWAPLLFRVPWNIISRSLSRGGVTVAGDAMHPMTPDLGQGACSSLEDAVVLAQQMGRSVIKNGEKFVVRDAAKAMERYVMQRGWRAAKLVTGSFISGWAQQMGSVFLRDKVFYRFVFPLILKGVAYDCGKLPQNPT